MQANIAKMEADLAGRPQARPAGHAQPPRSRRFATRWPTCRSRSSTSRSIGRSCRSSAWGKDLGGGDETIIAALHDRPGLRAPLPARGQGVLHEAANPRTSATVRNFDLLAPEGYGEIIGGSMREDDYDTARGAHQGRWAWTPSTTPGTWTCARTARCRTAASAWAIERTVAWICGLKHIRETIPFPRMMGKVYP